MPSIPPTECIRYIWRFCYRALLFFGLGVRTILRRHRGPHPCSGFGGSVSDVPLRRIGNRRFFDRRRVGSGDVSAVASLLRAQDRPFCLSNHFGIMVLSSYSRPGPRYTTGRTPRLATWDLLSGDGRRLFPRGRDCRGYVRPTSAARLVPIGRIAAIAALIVVPWLVVSGLATGAVFPDSGPASRYLAVHSGSSWFGNDLKSYYPR